jgi:hypothetical protein
VRKRSIKVLSALSASFPKSAVVDALMDAKTLTKAELEPLVDELRRSANTGTVSPRHSRRKTERSDGSPAARIKRVLTVDAGLSQQRSIQELRTELVATLNVALPSAKAASLDEWLNATMSVLPAGEVLNAAMTIAARHKPD